jgi:hypothetical protein
MDVAKVDQDVAHIAYFCKCFQWYVASVLKKNVSSVFKRMLQQLFYLDIAYVLYICCKCFIWMLHMFHTHMLQVFYLDISYVSHICCNNMFQMLHLCSTYVASKCFMLHVFHRGMVSDGLMTKVPGDGAP